MVTSFWETWPTLLGPVQWPVWFEKVQSYARRHDVWCHLDPENPENAAADTGPAYPWDPPSSRSPRQKQILADIFIAISKTVAPQYAAQVRALKSPSAALWWLRITILPSTEPSEEARAAARVWRLVTQRGERDWLCWCFALEASWHLCGKYKFPFVSERDMVDEFLKSIETFRMDTDTLDVYMNWYRPQLYATDFSLDFLIRDFDIRCEGWLADQEADNAQQPTMGTLREWRLQSLGQRSQLPGQSPADEKAVDVKGKAEESTTNGSKSKTRCPGCRDVHPGDHKVWWESCWIFREMDLEEGAREKTKALSRRVRETREIFVSTRLRVHVKEKEAAHSWLKCQRAEDAKRDDAGARRDARKRPRPRPRLDWSGR